jgi:hypothetical protein
MMLFVVIACKKDVYCNEEYLFKRINLDIKEISSEDTLADKDTTYYFVSKGLMNNDKWYNNRVLGVKGDSFKIRTCSELLFSIIKEKTTYRMIAIRYYKKNGLNYIYNNDADIAYNNIKILYAITDIATFRVFNIFSDEININHSLGLDSLILLK